MVNLFSGATLDFAAMNRTSYFPLDKLPSSACASPVPIPRGIRKNTKDR